MNTTERKIVIRIARFGDFDLIDRPYPGAFHRKSCIKGLGVYMHGTEPGRQKLFFDPVHWPIFDEIVEIFKQHKGTDFDQLLIILKSKKHELSKKKSE